MDIYKHFENLVVSAVNSVVSSELGEGDLSSNQIDLINKITIETPKDKSHGDLSTNAAMVLVKLLKKNPREIAEKIKHHLLSDSNIKLSSKEFSFFEDIAIANPGFINVKLNQYCFDVYLKSILDSGIRQYYKADKSQKINIEYVSANPTGPMHVGHGRGAVIGDALASVFAAVDHDVTKEYYINDAGSQIDVLAQSLWFRLQQERGEIAKDEPLPKDAYPGDYLIDLAKKLTSDAKLSSQIQSLKGYDNLKAYDNDEFKLIAVQAMMDLIRDDLQALNITHDVFFSEKQMRDNNQVEAAISELDKKGLLYQGTLPPPKDVDPATWEAREQLLFKSTNFGDDVDRAVKKSDGGLTYFAADIAYHKDKIARGFDRIINVWGADHGGYITRVSAVVDAFKGDKKVDFEVIITQLVRLFRGQELVRMSKRSGDFVTLREVVDEVGADAVRFMMLMRKSDAPLDFDLIAVKEQSKDNPVFYVQYAYARVCSIYRKAAEDGILANPTPKNAHNFITNNYQGVSKLVDEAEKEILALLSKYPKLIKSIESTNDIHKLPFYLYDLASSLHSYWTKGKEDESVRVLMHDDNNLTMQRLSLVEAVRLTIKDGLDILGVHSPETMA